jgi:chorismate mutase
MSHETQTETIEIFREKISNIDAQLIDLLIERFELTDKVGIVKKQNSIQIENVVVEGQIIDRLITKAHGKIDPYIVSRIYTEIFNESKKRQRKM